MYPQKAPLQSRETAALPYNPPSGRASMDKGIWAIWYGIAEDDKTAYLDWFHNVHIPEKLSRPGYRWAAHYALGHDGRGSGYVALFGGDSSHTFLNPSPGQLATRQSAETKQFIGMRRNTAAAILAEEIRIDGPDATKRGPGLTAAPVIQIGHFSDFTHDAVRAFANRHHRAPLGHAQIVLFAVMVGRTVGQPIGHTHDVSRNVPVDFCRMACHRRWLAHGAGGGRVGIRQGGWLSGHAEF
jgi:hypothetical protein